MSRRIPSLGASLLAVSLSASLSASLSTSALSTGLPALRGQVATGTLGLFAISSTSPWTMRELERAGADLVSFDPETGLAYVVADPEEQSRLVGLGFAVATVQPDLQAGLRALQGPTDLGRYHTWDETNVALDSLAAAFPGLCRVEVLGQSLEGRDIRALKISDAPQISDPAEPDVLFVGCHHAREFMSVEVPLHLARTLLEGYGQSEVSTAIVDGRETWIVPLLNVDGHVYQQQFQASPDWLPPGWRKNRRPNLNGTWGVDLNRNYPQFWGFDDEGSSSEGGDENYRGQAPFSEPETRVLQRLVQRERFVLSVSFHSFGRLVLYPWGYTRTQLTDDQPLFGALADSMVRSNGYTPGNAYFGTIYLTNGELDDWLYGEVSLRKPVSTLGFTVELNSPMEGGFWPSDDRIAPTCAAILPLNRFVLQVAGNPAAPLPPPAPVLAASQDSQDRRRIHLQWSQPHDAGNPVDHYEVFEIAFAPNAAGVPSIGASAAPTAVLSGSGSLPIATAIPRPASGTVVLRVDAMLEPLWDYAYIEARDADGTWRPLAGDATRDTSPTGRNTGRGLTGGFVQRRMVFRLDAIATPRLDLRLRLDAMAGAPRRPRIAARLDLAATYGEERRVIDPQVPGSPYDFTAQRAGLFAFGVTAVDVDGQKTDSELAFFVVPAVAVAISDLELGLVGETLELRWRNATPGPVRFEAWTRALREGERLADAEHEWARGDYRLVAALETSQSGTQRLAWAGAGGDWGVLLRGIDADGARLYGPLRAATPGVTRLGPAYPNPFNPGTAFTVELATTADAEITVYAPDGRRVRQLARRRLAAGAHRITWDGCDATGRPVASGVYIVRLQAAGQVQTRRLVRLD